MLGVVCKVFQTGALAKLLFSLSKCCAAVSYLQYCIGESFPKEIIRFLLFGTEEHCV